MPAPYPVPPCPVLRIVIAALSTLTTLHCPLCQVPLSVTTLDLYPGLREYTYSHPRAPGRP